MALWVGVNIYGCIIMVSVVNTSEMEVFVAGTCPEMVMFKSEKYGKSLSAVIPQLLILISSYLEKDHGDKIKRQSRTG